MCKGSVTWKQSKSCSLTWLERMLPRTYVFSHTDVPSSHSLQHILPRNVSQLQRIEDAHLNSTNHSFQRILPRDVSQQQRFEEAHLNSTNHSFQRILPRDVSQQQRIEDAHLNSTNHLFQHSLSHNVSQQQRIEEAYLNSTNFIGPPMNVPHVIPTYQWTPVELSDVSYSPNEPLESNRKRRIQDYSENDPKRQRFSCPSPHNQPARNANFISQPVTRPMSGREVTCPTCSSATFIPGGCVPSLGETCHQNAFSPSSVKDKLSQQILNLFYACKQQSVDLEKKESCRAALQSDIQKIFPCAQVVLGGSSLNGFGSRSSDADLCLIIKEGPVNHRKDAVSVLSSVRKLLYKLSYIDKPQLIRAKVPIVKFRDRTSGVEFDLHFNNTVGIRNTFLLRTYAFVEKRVRPIIVVIKKWASHHSINDPSRGTLSSYTLVLMVLHYLQTLSEPVIPCLQRDYPSCFDPKMDIHLVPSGPRNIPAFVSKNQSSLGQLLLGFLRYYATVFKWDKHVISVRMAKTLPKSNYKEWKDKFICVEEPFNHTNTARAVHERVKFEAIKAEFIESYRLLQFRKDLNCILPITKRKTAQRTRPQIASR